MAEIDEAAAVTLAERHRNDPYLFRLAQAALAWKARAEAAEAQANQAKLREANVREANVKVDA